jgi:hypothetical protein
MVVAERGWRRKGGPVAGFEESVRALTERGEAAVEPGVAEEGGVLESLCGDEGGGGCASAGVDRFERVPFGARESVRGRGQFFEQPLQRGREKRQGRGLACCPLDQCCGLRFLECGPGGCRCLESRGFCRAPCGPERLELACGELAEAGEGGLTGEGADDDQLGRSLCGVGEREHVEEL